MDKKYLDQYDTGDPGDDKNCLTQEQVAELAGLVDEVLFRFNEVEGEIEYLIAEATNARSYQPGYTISAELAGVFTKKVSIFRGLYGPLVEHAGSDRLKTMFSRLITKLYKMKDIRNDVAHANWLQASAEYEARVRIASDENGPYAVTKLLPPETLRGYAETMTAVSDELERFRELLDESLQ